MEYVIGVDLGTSAVKVLLVNREGEVCAEASKGYPLIQDEPGYSEQNPEDWVQRTCEALRELVRIADVAANDIVGISYSGQMHGLVLLNKHGRVLRNAILWNDTRTSEQCQQITEVLGEKLLKVTKNIALEGFTLPKLLWVKQHEPTIFQQAAKILLPKDYVRFRMTGAMHIDYSDAAGTLLLNVAERQWSDDVASSLGIPVTLLPPLVESSALVGTLLPEVAAETNLSPSTKVFAGGADNACGAVGAGILSTGSTMCSIGTSGVVLSYEEAGHHDAMGRIHFFNHAKSNAYYSMGVTLSAGYSLTWFKNLFAQGESYDAFLGEVGDTPIGSNGLIFTPYLFGERTPHADAKIRGSFIGIDSSHKKANFVRAVMEGITFSLNESIEIFRRSGKEIHMIVSIGGGAKNDVWLQMQADIFDTAVVKLDSEQGPGLGAAMLAAYGCGWFPSLEACASKFIRVAKTFSPVSQNVSQYRQLYEVYTQVYGATEGLSRRLEEFRR